MSLTTARVLGDAWALWRRDRDLLVRLAAPFLFLPDYALRLLVPPPLVKADAGQSLWSAVQEQAQFVSANFAAYLMAMAMLQFGLAALFAFYADRGSGDVRGALRRAPGLWPRLMLVALLVGVPTAAGMLLLVPGLVIAGRTLAAAPLLVGERSLGPVQAIWRSIRLTRGRTLTVTGLAGVVVLLRLAGWPFAQLDLWLRAVHAPNPVALAAVNAAGAGVSAVAELAGVLIAVAAYRGLTGASRGM